MQQSLTEDDTSKNDPTASAGETKRERKKSDPIRDTKILQEFEEIENKK